MVKRTGARVSKVKPQQRKAAAAMTKQHAHERRAALVGDAEEAQRQIDSGNLSSGDRKRKLHAIANLRSMMGILDRRLRHPN